VIRAIQMMKDVTKELGGPKQAAIDFEAIYHHLEDPTVELTETENRILDNVILALMRARRDGGLRGVTLEGLPQFSLPVSELSL